MRVEDFAYIRTTQKTAEEAIAAVQAKAKEKGFRVMSVHDVQATLAEKGFDRLPMTIVEVWNAKYTSQVLAKDNLPSLLMPCKVNVYVEGDTTYVAGLRPTMLAQFFPGKGLEPIAEEVDRIIRSIVDEAV